jgi:hypothetical protein
MKKLIQILFIGLMTAGVAVSADQKALPKPHELAVPEGTDPDLVKEAGNKAIKALLTDFLRQHDVPMKRYAILPLQQDVDGGYFTTQLRNFFSTEGGSDGYELYTRMDDEFKMLLNEIAWGQSYGDTMDPTTVQKFGRLQGVQGLITGRISGLSKYNTDDVKVRFTMQVFEVETGKLVWGEEKVAYGKRNDVEGGFWSYWNNQKTKWAVAIVCGLIVLAIVLRVIKAIGAAARPR